MAFTVLGVGVLLATVWYMLGGLPFSNHAAYGRVPVPGAGTMALPAGVVWIHFEEDGVSGENDSADMPADLRVDVASAAGSSGGPLPVERLSENLFSVSNEDTGHVPYGRIQVTVAGPYRVTTAALDQTSAVSPRVTLGEPPWNPFGPPIVGSFVLLAPFAVLALLLVLPLRRA